MKLQRSAKTSKGDVKKRGISLKTFNETFTEMLIAKIIL